MQKAEFRMPEKTEEELQADQELIASLKKDPAVKKLLAKEEIPESVLEERAYTFKRWRKEVAPCLGCRDLSECRQKRKGYRMGLSYDGLLQETMQACPYEREAEQKTAHLSNYLISDLGEELSCVRFREIRMSGESKEYTDAVLKVSTACENHQGIYLYGPMGTGKTYLAACAANYVAGSEGKPAFVHVPSWADRLNATYYSGEFRTELSRMKFADLLVLDDIGSEEVTDRLRSLLLSVLDARMQNHRMTWFTSNEDFASLKDHFTVSSKGNEDVMESERIMERIRVLAEPVFLAGSDRRHLYQSAE
ncbi:MAG: ATP-binding protein [Bulleidia sp.]